MALIQNIFLTIYICNQLLVMFVQKRDPRYKVYKEASEKEKETLAADMKKRAAKDRANYIAKLQEYQEQDWTKIEEDDDDDDEYDEEINNEIFCVACNKSYKNEGSWKDHEKSNKHLKNIELLKAEM